MKNIVFVILLAPILIFSQTAALSNGNNGGIDCQVAMFNFNKEMKTLLGDKAGRFWVENELLIFESKYGTKYYMPVATLYARANMKGKELVIDTNPRESVLFWTPKSKDTPQFTAQRTVYYAPNSNLSLTQIENHVKLLNEMFACLRKQLSPLNTPNPLPQVEDKKPEKFTDINIFYSGDSKSTNTNNGTTTAAPMKSPFEDAVNKGWDNYKNGGSTTCPICGGSGKTYTSQKVTNTYTTFSEDDANYYKKTETTESDYYQQVKCIRCGGSGKVQ